MRFENIARSIILVLTIGSLVLNMLLVPSDYSASTIGSDSSDEPSPLGDPGDFDIKWTYYGDLASGDYVMEYGLAPQAVDINSDGSMELFLINNTGTSGSDDTVMCLNGTTGGLIWSIHPSYSIIGHCPLLVYDLDNDDTYEVVVPGPTSVQVFNAEDGTLFWKTTGVKCGESNILVLDADNNSLPYIYVCSNTGAGALDLISKIRGWDGTIVDTSSYHYCCHGGLAALDIDGTGNYYLYTSDRNFGGGLGIRCYDADTLDLIWNRADIGCSSHVPVVYDVDHDGEMDVVISQQNNGGPPWAGMYVLNATTGANKTGMYQDAVTGLETHEQLAVYNFTGGDTYVLTGAYSDCMAFNLNTWIIDANLGYAGRPPYFANVMGDSEFEIIKSTEVTTIRIYNSDFVNVYNITGYGCYGSMVQDIDGDGLNELVTLSSNGTVRAYDTLAVSDSPLPRTQNNQYNEHNTRSAFYMPIPGYSAGAGADDDYINFDGGNGTALNPYKISNWTHLNNVRTYYTANFTLMNTLDNTISGYSTYNTGVGWDSIQPNSPYFIGHFNGNGYEINDLYINRSTTYRCGLFGRIYYGGSISNLGMRNASINCKGLSGILSCYVSYGATASNCYAYGEIHGHNYGSIGGLIDTITTGYVSDCYVDANVSTTYTDSAIIGGFAGTVIGGSTITRCYSTGNVTSNENATGGFVGNYDSSYINNSYSTSNVYRTAGSLATTIGGFVGYNYRGSIIDCYSTGLVEYISASNPTDKGFCGKQSTGGLYADVGNFFDTTTSNQTTTVGNAVGKTTAEMHTFSTFDTAGWDICIYEDLDPENLTIWTILNGTDYPRFADTGDQPYIYDSNSNTYPATGEGLIDAIAALSDGVEIWMPNGHYFVNESLYVFNDSVKIHGSGLDTVIEFDNNASFIFSKYASDGSDTVKFSAGLNNIMLDNFTITGCGSVEMVLGNNTVFDNLTAEYITRARPGAFRFILPPEYGVHDLDVINCHTNYTYWHGFQINSPPSNNNTLLENVNFTDCSAWWSGYPNELRSDSDGNWSVGFDLTENYGGVTMTTTNLTVTNCDAEYNWESGFGMEDSPTKTNFIFNNCTSKYNGQKYLFWTTGTNYKSGFMVSGVATLWYCNASYNYNYGFYCGGSTVKLYNYSGIYNLNGLTNGECNCTGNGAGTIDDPYIISTPSELNDTRNNKNAYYKLGNDIDLTAYCGVGGDGYNGGEGWDPITDLQGGFDGDGYNITGLYINRPTDDKIGLFLKVTGGATIHNVSVLDANVNGGVTIAGILVGWSYGGCVEYCYTTGTITSSAVSVGGLAGYLHTTYINNSYSTATVIGDTGSQRVGGLLGMNYQGCVQNCFSTGLVSTSAANKGGLVGLINAGGSYTDNNNFYDNQTSGQTTSLMGTGKYTNDMKNFSTFYSAGWDITNSTTSDLNNGYPYLSWQNGTHSTWLMHLDVFSSLTVTTLPASNITNNTATLKGFADFKNATGYGYQIGLNTSYGTNYSVPITWDNISGWDAEERWLHSGTYKRTAIKYVSFSGYPVSVDFRLKKNGSPTGSMYIRIRYVSNDTIWESITMNPSTLTTSWVWYTFNFSSLTYINNNDIYVSVEYSGGDGSNYVIVNMQGLVSGADNWEYVSFWKNVIFVTKARHFRYVPAFYNVTGLVQNTLYHFRAKAIDSVGIVYGEDKTFITKTDPPTNLTATPLYNTINLTWTKGTGANNTIIIRNQSGYPTNITSGTVAYNNTGNSYTDTGLNNGEGYYYRAWSYSTWDSLTQYSDDYSSDHDITIPEAPTNATITFLTGNSIQINWTKGTGANNTIAIRKSTGYPTSVTDGTLLYNGTGLYINDTFSYSTPYYYRVWSYSEWNSLYAYSTNYTNATYANYPSGGIFINCYDEDTGDNLTFNILVSNPDGSDTYYNTSCTNTLFINASLCPQGPVTIIVNATDHKQRIYSLTIDSGIIYVLNAYLPASTIVTPPGENPPTCTLQPFTNSISISNPAADATITHTHNLESIISVEIYNSTLYGTYGGWMFISEGSYTYNTTHTVINESVLDTNTTMVRVTYYYLYCPETTILTPLYYLRAVETITTDYTEIDRGVDEALITISKYMNATNEFETVSSLYTDANGYCNIYLIPNSLYKIKITKTGYDEKISDYIPAPANQWGQTAEKIFRITSTSSTTPTPETEYLMKNITYTVEPTNQVFYAPVTYYFNITSTDNKLEWYSMEVLYYNETTDLWEQLFYQQNIDIGGGSISYTIPNMTGKYEINCWFKKTGYDPYEIFQEGSLKGFFVAINEAIKDIPDVAYFIGLLVIMAFSMGAFALYFQGGLMTGFIGLGIFAIGLWMHPDLVISGIPGWLIFGVTTLVYLMALFLWSRL